jgi:hypothetical protein
VLPSLVGVLGRDHQSLSGFPILNQIFRTLSFANPDDA